MLYRSVRDLRRKERSAISGFKKEAAFAGGFQRTSKPHGDYLSWVEMLLNLPLRVLPMVFTVAMITTEMPAAIKPYSIAVAPDSSFRNARTRVMGLTRCGCF